MEELLAVKMRFLKLFRGFKFDKEFLKSFDIDELIAYTSEPEVEGLIDEKIKSQIESILSHTKKGINPYSFRFYMQ